MRHIRRCAEDASYAIVTPLYSATKFAEGGDEDLPGPLTAYAGGEVGGHLGYVTDVAAIDAFWYQLLSPGHVLRTGPLPGSVEVGDDMTELMLGDFGDWLREIEQTGSRRAVRSTRKWVEPGAQRLRGRSLLSPCFLTYEDVKALGRP